MIVTVTLNPALLVSYRAQRVRLGEANAVTGVRYRPGGRGLAVARILHTFGHDVVAAGLVGGAAGELLKSELARSGVPTQFTRISGQTRRVLKVADASTEVTTVFSEPAPYITTEELGRLAADYRALMADASAAVLCGSLPTGLPPETYSSLARYAAEAGVPAVIAAGGVALRHCASRRPALVIPDTPGAAPGPARLVADGAGAVTLFAGRFVRVVTAAGEWRAWLEEGDARGEGLPSSGEPGAAGARPADSLDALVAGFVPGVVLGWSWPDTLRHAIAVAAAADPTGEVDLAVYERLLPKVRLDPAAADAGTVP